jgi:Rieske Fe-S protein
MASHTPADHRSRRSFLSRIVGVAMAGGLIAAYGTLAAIMARFLYPARPTRKSWMFVADVGSLSQGESLVYHTPAGAPVNITRLERTGAAGDFIALSSTCPHLGCQVHWEVQNDRFFCPCHNGTFDPSGKATAGPPAEAGQSLPRFALKVEQNLLYIEVPTESA